MKILEAGASLPGAGDHGPSYFLEIVGFSEVLVLCRNVFGLLFLVKAKVLNFIGKPLNLPP